ncbi:MAG: tetratricopeptide repeat protein [Bacteroidota bacterium]|nr:tetratricopeptide repeat protein [Bacteroidota bacterium]
MFDNNGMRRLEQLISYHEEDPNDSFVRFALAAEYVKLNQLDDALAAFEALHAHDPSYLGLYYHFGKLLLRIDQPDRARAVFQEGIAVATRITDFHARSELQSALLEMEFDDA